MYAGYSKFKKKTYSKKTSSKKKYKKGVKTKSSLSVGNPVTAKRVATRIAKMPDQRMTRMEYKQGYVSNNMIQMPTDGRLTYAGFQNHGGYIPHLRTVAGSIVRDICGKNGLKFPTWNTGSTSVAASGDRDASRKQIYAFRFQYRGHCDNTEVTECGDEILVVDFAISGVRTMWNITKDLCDQFHTYARAGMYPFAYEVLVYDDSTAKYLVKFRDDNAAQMSVTVRVKTDLLASNITQNITGGRSMTDQDTVPLRVKRYIFRNSVPLLQDSVLTAADLTANYQDVFKIQNDEDIRGIIEMQHIYNSSEGFFNPFKTCPQGKVVFKNLRTTSTDVLRAGSSLKDASLFAFSGSLRKYLESSIVKDKRVVGSPRSFQTDGLTNNVTGYTFADIKAARTAQAGEARLFCFERYRTQYQDVSAADGKAAVDFPIEIKFAITHQAEAYVQPFKAVPLPKCRVDTNEWDRNPGNVLA